MKIRLPDITSVYFENSHVDFEGKTENSEVCVRFLIENDTSLIERVVCEVIANDPKSVADYKGGKEKALMALYGKCMKELRGNCDPLLLKRILTDAVNRR